MEDIKDIRDIQGYKALRYFIRKEEKDLICECINKALQTIPYKYADEFLTVFNHAYWEKSNGQSH
jgi:hypothetical protein